MIARNKNETMLVRLLIFRYFPQVYSLQNRIVTHITRLHGCYIYNRKATFNNMHEWEYKITSEYSLFVYLYTLNKRITKILVYDFYHMTGR